MPNQTDPKAASSQGVIYHIRLEGHLGQEWTNWFGGVDLTLENDETLLTCHLIDQAALYGLLRKVRDLGLPLLSVTRVETW